MGLAEVTWIGSSTAGCRLLFGPLAAISVDKLGFKATGCIGSALTTISMVVCYFSTSFALFAASYGGLMGLAFAFLYFPGTTCNVFYFREKIGLANGIVYSTAGVGKTAWSLAYSYIGEAFGLDGVLILNGIVALHLILPICMFHPNVDHANERMAASSARRLSSMDKSTLDSGSVTVSKYELFKSPVIWLFSLGAFFMGGGDAAALVFVPEIGSSLPNVTVRQKDMLMTYLGISSIFARVVVGWVSDTKNSFAIWGMGCLGSGLCCIIYPFLHSYFMMAIFTSILGFFIAAYISTTALAALQLFGIEQVNLACGMLHFCAGIGAFAIPPLIGYLFEFQLPASSITLVPCMGLCGVFVLAFLFFVLATIAQRKRDHRRIWWFMPATVVRRMSVFSTKQSK